MACATPQSCTPPETTALPICKLSQTGCMNGTQFAANAIYYEVNSPLWSDNAAKSRAFVIPDGGLIHVKDCDADAGSIDEDEVISDPDLFAQRVRRCVGVRREVRKLIHRNRPATGYQLDRCRGWPQ